MTFSETSFEIIIDLLTIDFDLKYFILIKDNFQLTVRALDEDALHDGSELGADLLQLRLVTARQEVKQRLLQS